MLFTDLLLVTKPATKRGGGDKVKIIKPPMRLDKIVVYGLRDAGMSLDAAKFVNTLWSIRFGFKWCKNYKNRPRNVRSYFRK